MKINVHHCVRVKSVFDGGKEMYNYPIISKAKLFLTESVILEMELIPLIAVKTAGYIIVSQ